MVFDKHTSMKKTGFIIIIAFICFGVKAQPTTDTVEKGKVRVIKDSRLDELAKKEASFNEIINLSPKSGRGYRLMVLSTNDRPLAMKARAELLQRYPDQKIYMSFQPPNIKLKFGNYAEKADAENVRKDILRSKIVTGNIYIVPDKIEIKPDKNNNSDR